MQNLLFIYLTRTRLLGIPPHFCEYCTTLHSLSTDPDNNLYKPPELQNGLRTSCWPRSPTIRDTNKEQLLCHSALKAIAPWHHLDFCCHSNAWSDQTYYKRTSKQRFSRKIPFGLIDCFKEAFFFIYARISKSKQYFNTILKNLLLQLLFLVHWRKGCF